jgi:hypothetical protein
MLFRAVLLHNRYQNQQKRDEANEIEERPPFIRIAAKTKGCPIHASKKNEIVTKRKNRSFVVLHERSKNSPSG